MTRATPGASAAVRDARVIAHVVECVDEASVTNVEQYDEALGVDSSERE